jgi:hypothetical protein
MSEQMTARTCHKTYQEKLRPTPAQERELERVLGRCRELYNTALEQRITAWQRCHVSLTRYQQEAVAPAVTRAVVACAVEAALDILPHAVRPKRSPATSTTTSQRPSALLMRAPLDGIRNTRRRLSLYAHRRLPKSQGRSRAAGNPIMPSAVCRLLSAVCRLLSALNTPEPRNGDAARPHALPSTSPTVARTAAR